MARPHAAASISDKGRPSRRDGNTATCAFAQNPAMSLDVTEPSDARVRSFQDFASASVTEAGLAGSGVPAIKSLASGMRVRSNRCAATSVRMPLSSRSRPTNPKVGAPSGSASRCEAIDVDARSGDERNPSLCNPKRHQCRHVVAVLHQSDTVLPVAEKAQQQTDKRADGARFAGVGREQIAKADEGVDAGGRPAERRQHSKHASLQSDVMGERGFDVTMHTAKRCDRRKGRERRQAAARERNSGAR